MYLRLLGSKSLILWSCLKIILVCSFISCSRLPISKRAVALKQNTNPNINWDNFDDLPLKPLIKGIKLHVEVLKRKKPNSTLTFGPTILTVKEYSDALEYLLKSYKGSKETFLQIVRANFEIYEVYGRDTHGDILLTSYYEPLIRGRRRPKGRFAQPLYRLPKDLVEVQLARYRGTTFPDDLVQINRKTYGRLIEGPYATKMLSVIPFFSRKQIDQEGALKGRKLELVYVDPVDAFFLQIQGSGTIQLPNGKNIRLGYAGQNGHKYVALGKHLHHIIPKEEMSLQKIEGHLRSLPNQDLNSVLNLNPSYVFFRKLRGRPETTFGTEVIAGRTVAIDTSLFPLGALGILVFPKPVFDENQKKLEDESIETGRFVLFQDSGGAIKGPDRADLFWGKGKEAKKYAGVMRDRSYLAFLVPNQKLLSQLKMKNKGLIAQGQKSSL